MVLAELGPNDRAVLFTALGTQLGAETSSDVIDILTILGQKGLLFVQASRKSIVIHGPHRTTRIDREQGIFKQWERGTPCT